MTTAQPAGKGRSWRWRPGPGTVRWATVAGLALAWAVGYFVLPRGLSFGPRLDPSLPWDALLPCVPQALWLYLPGMAIPFVPALLLPQADFLRAARAHALLIGASTLLFCLLPTDAAALRAQCPASAALASLQALDMPSNLFPSLHVGFAVLSAQCLRDLAPPWRVAGIAMAVLQVLAVCLVKQHYLADAAAGAALAWAAHAVALRPSTVVRPAAGGSVHPSSSR